MNPLAYAEATVATLVVAWLAAVLLTHPVALGAVVLFALLPLLLVGLPLLAVDAFAERTVTLGRTPRDRRADGTVADRVRGLTVERLPRADPPATEADNGAD